MVVNCTTVSLEPAAMSTELPPVTRLLARSDGVVRDAFLIWRWPRNSKSFFSCLRLNIN